MRKPIIHGSVITAFAICAPAVRMYVVYVFGVEGGTFGTRIKPVIAIKSVSVTSFWRQSRHENDLHEGLASIDQYIEEGWNCEGNDVEEHLVVHDEDDYGLIDHDDSLMMNCAEVRSVILCPWPYDEVRDQEHISKAIESLKLEAKAAYKRKVERDANIKSAHESKTAGSKS